MINNTSAICLQAAQQAGIKNSSSNSSKYQAEGNAATTSHLVTPTVDTMSAAWCAYLPSQVWQAELTEAFRLSESQFQIKAIDAVPQVLYAFIRHGLSSCPAHAVVAACHYGGDADTVAAMVGALIGALYGRQGLPSVWYDALENDHELGRDGILDVGRKLAALDVKT